MDTNKKLRTFMTKRAGKNDAVDVCLDSTQKIVDPVRRPLPFPRTDEPVNAVRHRPSPRPRNVTV